MSRFHPTTVAILREARAAALQNLAKGRRDADYMASIGESDTGLLFLDSAIEARAIVADLTRLLAIVEPLATPDPKPSEDSYSIANALAVATDLQQRTADVDLQLWDISYSRVKVMLAHGMDVAGTRATLTELAHRLGLKYKEKRHGTKAADGVMFAAVGTIDGHEIDLWRLRYDVPFCDRHQVAIVDGICDGCENTVGEDKPLQDWDRELLVSATDPTPGSAAAAEQRAATDTDTSGAATAYTSGQLDGRACERCGQEFTASQPRVADGLDLHGSKMRRHSKCPSKKPAASTRDAA